MPGGAGRKETPPDYLGVDLSKPGTHSGATPVGTLPPRAWEWAAGSPAHSRVDRPCPRRLGTDRLQGTRCALSDPFTALTPE